MQSGRIYLREMTEQDSTYLILWRNDPDIKKWFFNKKKLTLSEHLKWFKSTRDSRIDYIICDKNKDIPIGTLNYKNIFNDTAEIGKMIGDKKYWGKGIGRESFILWLDFGINVLGFNTIYSKTLANNVRNIRLNERFGFKVIDEAYVKIDDGNKTYKILTMELKREEYHEI